MTSNSNIEINHNPSNFTANPDQVYYCLLSKSNHLINLNGIPDNQTTSDEEFESILYDWWREEHHTPLNSSVISWTGDVSHIWKKFKANDQFYMEKYNKGSDEFYYREIEYETYDPVCYSIKNHLYKPNPKFSICTLGQMHHLMEKGWTGWWSDYFIN